MGLGVNRLQALQTHLGVDLGRRQRRMTQKLLDRDQIGTGVEEMGRKGVAQDVRADIALDARPQGVSFQNLPESHSGYRNAVPVQEYLLFLAIY